MYKDKLDGVISDADFAVFRESLDAEEQALAAQMSDIGQQLTECRRRQENAESQRAVIQKYTHFDQLDRSVADEFIDTVEIGMADENGEREIHIRWKF